MEKKQEDKQTTKPAVKTETNGGANGKLTPTRKVSKAWEAAQRLKGSVIVNDPTLYWR